MNSENHIWRAGNRNIGNRNRHKSMVPFDMSRDDSEPPDEWEYKPYKKQKIECRLLIKKYKQRSAAEARCREIHGTTFDGAFQSGRFWVFWSWEKRKCTY